MPAGLGGPGDPLYEMARDKERRQLIANVRYLSARVETLTVSHKLTELTMDALRKELASNTALTTEIRELLAAVRGGMKVLGWLGNGVKWIGGIALLSAAVSLMLGFAWQPSGPMSPNGEIGLLAVLTFILFQVTSGVAIIRGSFRS